MFYVVRVSLHLEIYVRIYLFVYLKLENNDIDPKKFVLAITPVMFYK